MDSKTPSTGSEKIAEAISSILSNIGENPGREGLQDTPIRVARAWHFWTKGYNEEPLDFLKEFKDGGETYAGMVSVENVPFYSHCEHHLAPFFGTATIAYIPNGKVVGLSKLSRVLDVFARRLQVQERLTEQVSNTLWDHLQPKAVGVRLLARHLCMESRGICKQGSETRTISLRGTFLDDPLARSEFISLANK